MAWRRSEGTRAVDRQILALAVPAFLALVAEPLFLLADSAVVGHLGTTELAGLGIASVVLRLAVGLCVFLAYATTAAVARELGAGQPRRALQQGVDGLWLALGIGVVLSTVGVLTTAPLVDLFGTDAEVAAAATTYLRISWLGLTPMLLLLAATGVLRGMADTRTPLVVAVAANLLNIVLNVVLVYGFDLGIGGSAAGTVIAQGAAGAYLAGAVLRAAAAQGATWHPDLPGVRRSARAGSPLLVRTLNLHACLLTMTWGAAALGTVATAAHQLAFTLWTFLAYALDALAIAAQTLTGTALGAGDLDRTRSLTRRMIRLGLGFGVLTGVVLALGAPVLGGLFVDDPAVVDALAPALLVAAVAQPLAGVVFVLDGILIGAGDGPYLAKAGTLVTVAFVPCALVVASVTDDLGATAGLVWLWVAFCVVFMGGRAAVLLRRARGNAWMVTGSAVAASPPH
ncbi:MATE family efflux transporter [Nocardioides sp. HDW12B]|uniref:MATE family efflux transporter n=1 Tax=Nocardioides sp. HDW12B TaxID=2714939 RepID=UPI00140CA15C|nr:MATE family efflux transporter [Nocardioides sp. HDW12B]QIK67955.1 MATE family efflux transporter [Nocardioides sp. HDW12B]